MGGTPSKTRKLTVENDDPTNVIKVSEDVVDRIKGVQQTVRQKIPQTSPSWPASRQNIPLGAPPVFIYDPNLTSIQLRQENVVQLKENDEYWKGRVKAMESSHKKMQEIMDQEYEKAVQEIAGKKTVHPSLKTPPCLESKDAVVHCYRSHPKEPMRCAKIVQAFQECVDTQRQCLINCK